jgi:hypothetical protein
MEVGYPGDLHFALHFLRWGQLKNYRQDFRRFFNSTTTLIDAKGEKNMMTAEAASRLPKDHPGKKSSGKPKKVPQKNKDLLTAVSEYSLAGFLEEEPDLYSVADVKVRYR